METDFGESYGLHCVAIVAKLGHTFTPRDTVVGLTGDDIC
jgi:hypothetical protein